MRLHESERGGPANLHNSRMKAQGRHRSYVSQRRSSERCLEFTTRDSIISYARQVASIGTIKSAAIIRAGFDYQDLAGLEVLIRHFQDPKLYSWVELEAEDQAVQSLDDVIALRRDGGVEYVQVKFTVDADTYPLDWAWLLERKKRGSSMLAKWARAFTRARSYGPVASAALRTNRRPSAAFAACLDGPHVSLDRLEADMLATIEAECGGRDDARAFFEAFAFIGALPDLVRFERSLRDRLVPSDTDETGWLRLRDQVRHWATFRGSPSPDGRILREHLVQLITRKRPQPIRQDFSIPDGYAPPSEAFDRALRKRTESGQTPLTIVWGSPGRGKSTYLSHLTRSLQQLRHVVLRHHYFLPNDQAGNRTSYFEIANSLLHQLDGQRDDLVPDSRDDPNALCRTLALAAAMLAREGQKLYLIVDGLDHVWRDTERIDQLNQLFGALLPLPDGVVLVVGTQRVPDAQLPKRLLASAEPADWIEIPRMDEAAVHHWVAQQDADRPFRLEYASNDRGEEVSGIASALFKISAGHPLHLIYSTESLRLGDRPITSDSISALPACPDGDIRAYYRRLWTSLGVEARELLHGLAGADFHWPSTGVRACFGAQHDVAFLLEPRASGLSPFHGSLFAWIRELPEHEETYSGLLPRIVAWLDGQAPRYWRWGWLWLAKAEAGDPSDLFAGCTRDWAVKSLAEGWSEVQIDKVVAAAERIAFDRGDLADAVRLRGVRHRVTNARQFQSRNFAQFRATGLAAHSNHQQVANLIDSPVEVEDDEWTQLVLHAPSDRRSEVAGAAVEELWRRVAAWIALRHKPGQDFDRTLDALVRCAARDGVIGLPRLLRLLARHRDPQSLFDRFVRGLGDAGDIDTLKVLRRSLSGRAHAETRRRCQEEMLRAAWRQGGDPVQLLGRFVLLSPLLAARTVLRDPTARPRLDLPPPPGDIVKRRYRGQKSPGLEKFFRDYFWSAVVVRRTGDPSAGYHGLDRSGLGWARNALEILDGAADGIVTGDVRPCFATLFIELADLAPVAFSNEREQDYFQYVAFRKAIARLSIDLHLLGSEEDGDWRIPLCSFEIARGSMHWVDEIWLAGNAADAVPHLSVEAATRFLPELAGKFSAEVSDFAERGESWTQLAALAHLYRVPDAKLWMGRAADCVLGYGHHKDLSAIQMLEAIVTVHPTDAGRSADWIRAVAPIIEHVTEFTDGDETDHVRSQLIDAVAATSPERLGAMHGYHMHRNEWRYSDECLAASIRLIDFDSPEASGLARTLLDPKMLRELGKRGSDDPVAAVLHSDQLRYLGGESVEKTDRYTSDDDWMNRKATRVVNPKRYAPGRFGAFVDDVAGADVSYTETPILMRRWLDHWASRGRAIEALNAIETYFDEHDRTWAIEELLDHVFAVSLAAEGPARAYAWLVRAHVQRNGWTDTLSSSATVEKRLRTAALHYADRWRDYIRDTSVQRHSWRHSGLWFAMGSEYLVLFLVLVGQPHKAAEVADALVQGFVDETRDQPVGTVAWLQ